ncbi:MAG: 1-deoxy-D-xylulose-5-phosphate reductoisomerase [Acidimicrobiia bacterium]
MTTSRARRRVVLLGSTGSIGTQTLDVIARHPDDFEVIALAAGRNTDLLAAQAAAFGVPADRARSAVDDPALLAELAALPEADVVVNAVVGFAGLPATLAALECGKVLALANKESLIAGGPVVAKVRHSGGGEIVPVDSEHSAIFQALRSGRAHEVRRIILTASGGPFRGRTRAELERVTVKDALAHPTWTMGAKITIDSSTLMNKGLEVIEARELFGDALHGPRPGMPDAADEFARIDVVVHPQSVVHSMVEYIDGSTIAQLSMPDMRLPIGLGLSAPDRLGEPFGAIDWATLGALSFEAPDFETFPSLGLAYEAGRAGGAAPAMLSGANEIAVEAFLTERIAWTMIPEVVAEVLNQGTGNVSSVADVLEADRVARERAHAAIGRRA